MKAPADSDAESNLSRKRLGGDDEARPQQPDVALHHKTTAHNKVSASHDTHG